MCYKMNHICRKTIICNFCSKQLTIFIFQFQGVRASTTDFCAQRNPCENNGICISVDRGTMCDCRFVPFHGDFCERRKSKRNIY